MNHKEPIAAAVLTANSPGAIAVVAVAGPEATHVVARVCRDSKGGAVSLMQDRPRRLTIVDDNDVLDDAIVTVFERDGMPRVEICVHGGTRIVERIVHLLDRQGVTRVEPMTLERGCGDACAFRRDADIALLRAESRKLGAWLLAQRRLLPDYMARWDGLDDAERTAFCRRTEPAIRCVRGIRIAIVGPPNAGKSTLANRLIGHSRVIVSDEAGTTRDWIDETAIVDGWPVTLTDTAGVRETDCDIESEAIRRGVARAGESDLILILSDSTAVVAERRRALDQTRNAIESAAPRIHVLNKIDAAGELEFLDADVLPISARSGEGMDALEARIAKRLQLDALDANLPTGFFPAHLEGRPQCDANEEQT